MFYTILTRLEGKKGAIASIVGIVVTFLLTKGYIDADTAYAIGALSTVFFGTASFETYKMKNPTV